ncbi:MAG: AMP-binding protein [Rhodobiaceae bacterium]|nr:AMP-binding protein [Rhodobiaceae bacterium]
MNDPRMPAREDCLVSELLDRRAATQGDQTAIIFEDGTSWTYADLRGRVRSFATALQALGVGYQDYVLSWLPNGPHALTLWYALNYIGAIYVPINTAYRGTLLDHVVENSGASLMIADERLVEHLEGRTFSNLARVVVVGDRSKGHHESIEFLDEATLTSAQGEPASPTEPVQPWNTMMVIYTSGTTGPSKGVMISYVQAVSASRSHYWVTGEDRALVSLPLFHIGGTWPTYRALATGGSIAMISGFTTSTFWDTVRDNQITNVTLVSAMVSFLVRAPASDGDRDNTLKTVSAVPVNEDAMNFGKRFGVDIYSSFGMTEISAPITIGPNPDIIGSCGRPRAGVEARIVDENDCEVAVGEMGELILRSDTPWAFNHGYLKNPEGTARAWRNGWFHTGDGFKRDADGNFYFVDRIKDAIRRRGENISAYEVEREILEHAAVAQAAVVGIRSEHGEDEVLAVVVLKPDAALTHQELFEYLQPRMAHFMLPRYIRIAAELPYTPTHKLQKYLLRELTPDTWDRTEAGIEVRRQALAAKTISG